jgi:hypothetical protein
MPSRKPVAFEHLATHARRVAGDLDAGADLGHHLGLF